jgi:anti-anti-sigma factor
MSALDIAIVRPHGRLDAQKAQPLEQELRQHLARGHVRILIDLGDVRYISSNGLRVLLRISRAARQSGGGLKTCCATARVTEIFRMAGLDQVLEMYDHRVDAERAFEG